MFPGKGQVKTYLDKPYTFPQPGQVVDCLFYNIATGGHGHNNPLCLRITHVVKEIILPAHKITHLCHLFFHNVNNTIVIGV